MAKRLPKAFQKTDQNYPKPLRNSVKALWRRSLGARTKKSSFLKDVLNEITVLRGSKDLAWGPKPRKKVFGGIPETSSRGLKMISEAGTPQKSFFIKQNRIFWLRPPVNVAKRLPKALQKTNQNYPKLHWNNVKALSRSILGSRIKKTAFLIDVLNEITVLRGPEDLAWVSKPRKNYFRGIPEASSRRPKMVSETGTPQKSFFAPKPNWEICCFRPWNLENGPQLYIDVCPRNIYVCLGNIYVYMCSRNIYR